MDTVRKRSTEAYHATTLSEKGIGYVTVARFKLSGETEIGAFLVDVFCQGVKDAFFTRMWQGEYDRDFLAKVFGSEGKTAIEPACARKWVQEAVAYAERLGFAPHTDYRVASRVLGGLDAGKCDRTFEFGKEGKPFFIQGPNDSPASVQAGLRKLRERCGDGNYNFLVLDGSQGDITLPGSRVVHAPPPEEV